ncbi:MAG: hypothetical protein CFE29_03630 [Bradyrhizobiaceae bacterium PARB1]|nr:MAG: hypothetical protein CFE29_03630 [Bradyrhizobiaceae bacterium PARB1]
MIGDQIQAVRILDLGIRIGKGIERIDSLTPIEVIGRLDRSAINQRVIRRSFILMRVHIVLTGRIIPTGGNVG